ncbi:ATP-binding protein [Candidatus Kapabacteria bacterium]|nr:ATP-binding protein [Candidatus Kapabacteria bacterium]
MTESTKQIDLSELELLKREKELLQKQLNWYKSFFDNATDAVFIVQPDSWSVLEVNDFASTMLGTPKVKLMGSVLPQFRRIFKLLKKSNSPIVLSEISLDTPDNKSLMVEVSARFVDYDGQKLIHAIARDVSEQHALTDKMVQADKLVLLGQLSAGVAHEIRNPLAAVNLNLQMLQRKFEDTNPLYNYVRTAMQGVERITRIVEVTLNFSRPNVPEVKPLSLNSTIQSSLELTRSSLKRKDIKLEIEFDENLTVVPADFKQMQQVFINLITNAADAIETKGIIRLKTYIEKSTKINEGEYVVAEVSDDGIGMSPEDMKKIFNPFFTRKPEGTGLGLPITQRILHNHNGVIDVESKVGNGTIFYVKLPIPVN